MTRDEFVDQVIRPYKDGDIVEYRPNRNIGADPYWTVRLIGEDPLGTKFDLENCEYRIKPRVVKCIVEIPEEHTVLSCFKNLSKWMARNESPGFSDWFVEAIRNAKPLPEDSNA